MSVYIEILARKENGSPVKYEGEGICYAVIGKSDCRLGRIRDEIGNAQPLTLAHKNMANIHIEWTEERRAAFREAFKVLPFFRTCLSSPDDILTDGRALFDVANYSLNEVMYCMFIMRQFCNDHCAAYYTSEFDDLGHNIDRIVAFTSRGKPWWMGFMAMLAPSLDGEGHYRYDLGGRDASCFDYAYVNPKSFYKLCTGQESPKFCTETYREVIDEDEGYTRNILTLCSNGTTSSNMAMVWEDLNGVLAGDSEGTDLFGAPMSMRDSRVSNVDELVEATSEFFENTFREWM